jgi:hypothetical protein
VREREREGEGERAVRTCGCGRKVVAPHNSLPSASLAGAGLTSSRFGSAMWRSGRSFIRFTDSQFSGVRFEAQGGERLGSA